MYHMVLLQSAQSPEVEANGRSSIRTRIGFLFGDDLTGWLAGEAHINQKRVVLRVSGSL